jgi:hypothetical protein
MPTPREFTRAHVLGARLASFGLYASGSSTVENLSAHSQPITNAVLVASNPIDADEPAEARRPQ